MLVHALHWAALHIARGLLTSPFNRFRGRRVMNLFLLPTVSLSDVSSKHMVLPL